MKRIWKLPGALEYLEDGTAHPPWRLDYHSQRIGFHRRQIA